MGLSLSDRFALMRKEGEKVEEERARRPVVHVNRSKVNVGSNSIGRRNVARNVAGRNRVPDLAQEKIDARNGQGQTPAFATARKIAARAKTYLAQNSGGVTKRAPIQQNRSRSALSGYPLAALTQALLEASTKMAVNDQRNQRNNMQRNGGQQNPGRQT